jgi:UDP-N-acetylmuramyl tripeptide synthase
VYFGVAGAARAGDSGPEVVDTRTCPRCGSVLDFSQRYYSHIGQWACTGCGYARPLAAVQASDVRPRGLDAVQFALTTPLGTRAVTLPLPGLYNVYNALAAAAAGARMGATLDATRTAIERFTPVFGRAERISVDGREVRILLAKNPTGLNEVLRALAGGSLTGDAPVTRHLLLMLNDRAADGEDVSWIWDADYERVAGLARSLVVSGNRAPDLAVRMKYAGVLGAPVPIGAAAGPGAGSNGASANGGPTAGDLPITVEPRVGPALDAALANVAAGETLYVVPTYTAMLAIRGELERRGYAPRYWENLDR